MIIPLNELDQKILRAVIEEYVTRDGTEFTDVSVKISQVEALLRKGKAHILFDAASKTCNIVPVGEELR